MPLNRYSKVNSWMHPGSTIFVYTSKRMLLNIAHPQITLEIVHKDSWRSSWGDNKSTEFQNIRFGLENSDFIIDFVFRQVQR